MDIKQNSTMIIALAIAVVVVMSVMVPVISDVMESDDSGSGSSEPLPTETKTYTNVGDAYLQEPDGQEHVITVDVKSDHVQFTFDGEVLLEKPIGLTDEWVVPLYYRSDYNIPEKLDAINIIWGMTDVNWFTYHALMIGDCHTYNSNGDMTYDTGEYTLPEDINGEGGNWLTITTNYNGNPNSIYIVKHTVRDPMPGTDEAQLYLSNQGEYAYAKNPIIKEDTLVGVDGYTCYRTASGTTLTENYSLKVHGWDTLSEISQNSLYSEGNYKKDGSSHYLGAIYDIYATPYENAIKLEKIIISSPFDPLVPYNIITVDTFIVPTEVTVEPKEYPMNGYWALANGEEFDIYVSETENNEVLLYTESPETATDPFYTSMIIPSISPIIPLAIGEKFYAYAALDDGEAEIDIMGVTDDGKRLYNAYTYEVHISGSKMTFETEIDGDLQEIELSGLYAHISTEGDYRAYLSAFTGKISYSAILYSPYNTNTDVGMDVVAVADGSKILWSDGGVYDSDTGSEWKSESAKITYLRENGMNTGIKLEGSFQNGDTLNTEIRYGSVDTQSGSDVQAYTLFSVGTSGGSGGSGGLSPTLVTVLSIIPIMVLVGLVLMAVRSMKV